MTPYLDRSWSARKPIPSLEAQVESAVRFSLPQATLGVGHRCGFAWRSAGDATSLQRSGANLKTFARSALLAFDPEHSLDRTDPGTGSSRRCLRAESILSEAPAMAARLKSGRISSSRGLRHGKRPLYLDLRYRSKNALLRRGHSSAEPRSGLR